MNQPNEFTILTAEIPAEFLEELGRHLQPYSVAIARVRNDDAQTFRALGTGVLVKKDGRFGILTAHHCLHSDRVKPEVKLGHKGGDTLALILRGGRQLIIDPTDVQEVELAFPIDKKYNEYGPDLTFIEITSPDRKGSIEAIGSFWNLDRDKGEILKNFSEPGTPLASVGFPGIDYNTKIAENEIRHVVKNMTYANALAKGDVFTKDEWDYIDLSCTYSSTNNLPTTFGGVSGGPVWGYQLRYSKETSKYHIGDYALLGIKFWETPIVDHRRKLRAHFINSIYDIAWRASHRPTQELSIPHFIKLNSTPPVEAIANPDWEPPISPPAADESEHTGEA